MAIPSIPNPPQLVSDQSRGSNSLQLSWTVVSEVDSYDIRFVNTIANTTEIRSNVNSGDSFSELEENTLYAISIRAVNSEGASDFSSALNVRTRPPTPNAPKLLESGLPSGEMSPRGPEFLYLTFDSVGSQYKYDFRLNGSDVRLDPGSKIDSLKPNNRYEVEVRARDELTDNSSFWSPSFVTITRPETPPSLDNISSSSITFSLTIQWDIAGDLGDFIQLKRVIDTTEEILVNQGELKGSHETRNTNSGISSQT